MMTWSVLSAAGARISAPPRIPTKPPARSMAAAAAATTISFDEYLSSKRLRVNEALNTVIPVGNQPETNNNKIYDSMRYSLLAGGKRVRPILAIAACELVGGDEAAAMPVACAAEMIHTMSLVHDDLPCIDDDGLRRGRPTNHVVFGEAVAVLAGDAMLALAFRHVVAGAVGSPESVIRAVAELGSAAEGLAAGQVADVCSEGKEVDFQLLRYIHEHKTGRLIEAAAVCGAVVGGGGEEEVERVRRYGQRIGLLFQVVDDILDVTRSSGELGKTAGKDLASDKSTYPKLMGLRGAREFAGELMGQAEAELDGFEPARAEPLRHFIHYIGCREN